MPVDPVIFVDMDDVLCDFSGARAEARFLDPMNPFPQSVPGFFEGLVPIPGAIESVNALRQQFNVWVLTAPSTRNPHCYTEKRLWIESWFDYAFTKHLIISPDKGLLKGDFLVDDQPHGKGQERFGGELIQFATPRFPSWESVVAYLVESTE